MPESPLVPLVGVRRLARISKVSGLIIQCMTNSNRSCANCFLHDQLEGRNDLHGRLWSWFGHYAPKAKSCGAGQGLPKFQLQIPLQLRIPV